MRFISKSVSASRSLADHTKFEQVKIANMGDALHVINRGIWSPIVWSDGKRCSAGFLFSDYCGLDFDDTLSIDEAIGIFKDYRAIIATTENHRKVKNGVYADRFRVIVPWERRITCRDEYVHNMTLAIKEFGADQACKDAGRLFKPSVQVALLNDADDMPVREVPPKEVARQAVTAGVMPSWLRNMVVRGSDGEPGRNVAAFNIAAACIRHGVGGVFEVLKSSYGVNTLSDAELLMVVRSAQKVCGLKATDLQAADI